MIIIIVSQYNKYISKFIDIFIYKNTNLGTGKKRDLYIKTDFIIAYSNFTSTAEGVLKALGSSPSPLTGLWLA